MEGDLKIGKAELMPGFKVTVFFYNEAHNYVAFIF